MPRPIWRPPRSSRSGTVALYLGYLLLPNYLEEVRGYSRAVIGSLFSVLSMGTVLFNALTGRIQARAGFAVLLAAPWVALALLWQVPSLPCTVLSFALLGAISSTWPLIQASIDRVVQLANRGVALGVVETLTRLALAAASAIAGRLYDQSAAPDLPFQLAMVAMPLMLLVWLCVPQPFFAKRIPSPY